MNMGKIIEDSFKFPASNWKRVLIFGVLVVIFQFSLQLFALYIDTQGVLLIIPFIIAYLLMEGYTLRTIGTSIKWEIEPPEFNNWLKMLVDGFKMILVGLVYGIIPGIILGVGLFLLIALPTGPYLPGILLLLLGLVTLFIVSLLTVMAISNMAYYGELGAAFRFSEVIGKIKKLGWLDYILVLIVLVILSAILSTGGSVSNIYTYFGTGFSVSYHLSI